MTVGGNNVAVATYDTPGRLATVTRYNSGTAGAVTTYDYDGVDRTTLLETVQSSTTLGQFTAAYDRAGQVTQASEAVGGTSRTIDYTYDGLHRLSTAAESGGNSYAYGYDNAGNRTSVTVNSGTPATTSYDAADQITTSGYSYDDAGNLLDDGTLTYFSWEHLPARAPCHRRPPSKICAR